MDEFHRKTIDDVTHPTPPNPPGIEPDAEVTTPFDLFSKPADEIAGIGQQDGFVAVLPIPATTNARRGGEGISIDPVPGAPAPHHQATTAQEAASITPVPEPGFLAALSCGVMVLVRPARGSVRGRRTIR